MAKVHVKICGISDAATLKATINAGADMVGFVHFASSPRHVSLDKAAELKVLLPPDVPCAMVVVNPTDMLLDEIITKINPDFIQLHGNETRERVYDIRRQHPAHKIIKAMPVSEDIDIGASQEYMPYIDRLMFDAKPPKGKSMPGGNGITFDWALLNDRHIPLPWILSGGLTPLNIRTALAQSGAHFVDVSSGVESAPGVKDAALINQFIRAAKNET